MCAEVFAKNSRPRYLRRTGEMPSKERLGNEPWPEAPAESEAAGSEKPDTPDSEMGPSESGEMEADEALDAAVGAASAARGPEAPEPVAPEEKAAMGEVAAGCGSRFMPKLPGASKDRPP